MVMLHPTSQPVQIDGFLSRYQTRSAKRKRVEVRAPTGQTSTTQVASGLLSSFPGKVPISARAPRLKKPSSPVPAISWVKRTQRVHWMHRFMLRMTLAPSGMRSRPG
jgi:hypothetical protein